MRRRPSGTEVARNGRIVTWDCLKTNASTAPNGLWRIAVAPPNKPKPKFGAMRLDMTGVPGALFLSKDKYWRLKMEDKMKSRLLCALTCALAAVMASAAVST